MQQPDDYTASPPRMTLHNLVSVRDLALSYGPDTIFDGVDFGVSDGERIALVGPNGCGKSTLFRILAGRVRPDDGVVAVREGTTISFLPQEVEFSHDETPRAIVARAVEDVRAAIARHEEVSGRIASGAGDIDELLDEQHELQGRIRNMGGWDWEHRVEEMLDRLALTRWLDTPVGGLSGGQQRRVDLARVLLESPDLLLLDEPTNHLDADTVEWLEGWLKGRSKTLLLVTHDRYFLERVARRIVEIDEEGLFDYPGNYETFMERKLHRMDVRRRTERRRQKLLAKELEWLRGGIKAQNTRSQKRIKQIEELKEEESSFEEEQMEMDLAEGGRLGNVILSGLGLDKSYGDITLLENASISLTPGDKIGLVGPNGCGKTTLLRMLMELEPPDAGRIEKGKKTDIGYLRQDGLPVDPESTVYEALGESDYVWVGDSKFHKRDYLRQFLFDEKLQKTQVRILSGGQKRRLALAALVAENANVLILDEPTNDLDILSLQALEAALEDFDGCILAVSHDRYFLNRACNVIIAFEDNKLVRYEGNYDEYRRKREDIEEDDHGAVDVTAEPVSGPAPEPEEAPSSGLTYAERIRLQELEEEIATAEEERARIEKTLSDPDLYAERKGEIGALNQELHTVNAQIEALYDDWAALEERRSSD